MLTFIDCSTPLTHYPQADGIAFYVGGDTPHVWTLAELNATPYWRRLPIWVRSNPEQVDPTNDAIAATKAFRSYNPPSGILVALDSEMDVDPSWVSTFFQVIAQSGFTLMDYGSQSVVFGNKIPNGYYWGAEWNNIQHIAPGDVMTQWENAGGYDISEAEENLPFWNTHAVPPVPPLPGIWKQILGVYYVEATGKAVIVGLGTDNQVYEIVEQSPSIWTQPVLIGGKIHLA
jgi:hypothetical protein